MKVNDNIDSPKSFKVGIIKCFYIELDEKIIDYSVKLEKGEKREPILTGNKIYFMKADLFEKRAGNGTPKYIQGEFSITKEQYETKCFEKGDILQIVSGSTLRIDNFIIKDRNKKSLELHDKKYHKMLIENGKSIPYVEKRIANATIVCKQDQYKLFSKKNNLKHYYLVENYKFEIAETEIQDRVFTFYMDEDIANNLKHLHGKDKVRIELWSSIKRIKVHTAKTEFGFFEGQHFMNVTLTTESPEVLKAQREQKQAEKEEKLRKEQEREQKKAEKLKREQEERERLERIEQERLAELRRIEEEQEQERKRLAEIEKQKRLAEIERLGKKQVFLRIGDD